MNAIVKFAYERRRHIKRLLSFLITITPGFVGRKIALVSENFAFKLSPDYQGDTLPPIFHYWSNKFLHPILLKHGYESPEDFYRKQLLSAASLTTGRPMKVMSLGSGAASLELGLLQFLASNDIDASMLCVDLNKELMIQAKQNAISSGLHSFEFELFDCNKSMPSGTFDVILVNQFFHHVANLELFCELLEERLSQNGMIITSDIVGRNGHVLWPSVDTVVQTAWGKLSTDQKFDAYFGKSMHSYRSVNHAAYSNEGVKAQEVVEQLLRHFDFELFLTYGAAIIPFVERRIGFNFSTENPEARSLVDSIALSDQENISAAKYPASNMLALLRKKGFAGERVHDPISPELHSELTHRELLLCQAQDSEAG